MKNYVHLLLIILLPWSAEAKDVKVANPSSYRKALQSLNAGDTLRLEAGIYTMGLPLTNCNGRADAWISIEGPAAGEAEIRQSAEANCVELRHCTYLALRRLKIQGGGPSGISGLFGISAKGGLTNTVHHILIEDCIICDWNTSQQAVGISTKTPTWDWTIRRNKIINCGTGLYLGNSNGNEPFIQGVIENNLVQNPIGYCMEIKFQNPRPAIDQIPTTAASTIIRHNVFIKNDAVSPDGDRPNVLVGGFPDTGPGSSDLYEIYGNFFLHNPRESLLHASGRVTIHDNIFADCPSAEYAAITLRDHDLPLKMAHIYHNTITAAARGIRIGKAAPGAHAIIGNVVFADEPLSLASSLNQVAANITGPMTAATEYLIQPDTAAKGVNFQPRPGRCEGEALDLNPFAAETGHDVDFNGSQKGGMRHRGAYAGPSSRPIWQPQPGIKPQP
jgi:hypothetical protein